MSEFWNMLTSNKELMKAIFDNETDIGKKLRDAESNYKQAIVFSILKVIIVFALCMGVSYLRFRIWRN